MNKFIYESEALFSDWMHDESPGNTLIRYQATNDTPNLDDRCELGQYRSFGEAKAAELSRLVKIRMEAEQSIEELLSMNQVDTPTRENPYF